MHVENVDHICIPSIFMASKAANIAGHIHISCILNLYAIFTIYVNTDNTDPTATPLTKSRILHWYNTNVLIQSMLQNCFVIKM